MPAKCDSYAGFVSEASARFAIPARWLCALMHVESNNHPHAVSPKGAMGLMQLMPGTWGALRMRLRLGDDPFGPHDNIVAGAAYLRAMIDRYGVPGAFAAYNAGPGRYEDFRDRHRPLPRQTSAYVAQLTSILDAPNAPDASQSAPTRVVSWTAAPLFVLQPPSRSKSGPAAADRSPRDADYAADMPGLTRLAPPTHGLFVVLPATGTMP